MNINQTDGAMHTPRNHAPATYLQSNTRAARTERGEVHQPQSSARRFLLRHGRKWSETLLAAVAVCHRGRPQGDGCGRGASRPP